VAHGILRTSAEEENERERAPLFEGAKKGRFRGFLRAFDSNGNPPLAIVLGTSSHVVVTLSGSSQLEGRRTVPCVSGKNGLVLL
jgi:hypothetical protein